MRIPAAVFKALSDRLRSLPERDRPVRRSAKAGVSFTRYLVAEKWISARSQAVFGSNWIRNSESNSLASRTVGLRQLRFAPSKWRQPCWENFGTRKRYRMFCHYFNFPPFPTFAAAPNFVAPW